MRHFILFAGLGLMACGEQEAKEQPPEPADCGALSVAPAVGVSAEGTFRMVEPGDEVPITFILFQGFGHYEMAGTVTAGGADVRANFSVRVGDRVQLFESQAASLFGLSERGECEGVFEIPLVFESVGMPSDYLCPMVGQDLEVCWELEAFESGQITEDCISLVVSDIFGVDCE